MPSYAGRRAGRAGSVCMYESLSRNARTYGRDARSRRRLRLGVTLAIVATLVGAGLYLYLRPPPPAQAPAVSATVGEPEVEASPRDAEPAPDETPAATDATRSEPAPRVPLPPLDESDSEISGALTELVGAGPVETWLRPESVIRNLVVTIDNLSRTELALDQRPFQPAPGEFVVSGPEDTRVLDPANYERYEPFVELVAALDAESVVELYARYRPLFNEAYRDLGFPEGEFDARLVEVVDHMLGAPTMEAPIRLTQPSVMYEFADDDLETLSPGHKLMIRMGPDNAAVIKRKLEQLRAALAGVAGTRGAAR